MLLILLIIIFFAKNDCKEAPRIYRGQPDTDNDYPYVVAIERIINNRSRRFCTGNLIETDWVVTAAHCLGIKNITVTYGDRSTRTISKAKSILEIAHPLHFADYNKETWKVINDIGLIKVEKIPIEKLGRLTIYDYRYSYELPVLFAGYGVTWLERNLTSAEDKERRESLYRKPLLIGQGVIVECDATRSLWYPSICVGVGPTGSMARFGDSGGPLLYNGTIIGISSGLRVRHTGLNEMRFVPVAFFIEWIRDVIDRDRRPTTMYHFDIDSGNSFY